MGKGYILLFWIETKRTDVVKYLAIPSKFRKEGAITTLKWRNPVNGKTENHFAKILKIAKNKREFDHLKIDPDTGTVVESSSMKKKSELFYEKRKKNVTGAVIAKKTRKNRKKRKHESSDDDSSTEESSSENEESENDAVISSNNKEEAKQLETLLSSVTYENINFIRRLLPLMEKSYERQQNILASEISSVTDPIEIVNEDLANFHSSLEGFLPSLTLKSIFHRNQDLNDWKKLVTDILVEIYGKQLAFFSAKGRRGAQGIDPMLFRAIYDLINLRLGWILLPKEFVRHINKVCSNRKKYIRTKVRPDPLNSIPDPIEVVETYNNVVGGAASVFEIDIKEEPIGAVDTCDTILDQKNIYQEDIRPDDVNPADNNVTKS